MLLRPLTKQEFAAAMKKGQGRVLQHVTQFGMRYCKDLVLNACLHDQNYDSQIDSSRAPWLFSMFHNTVFYQEFRETIVNNIETSSSRDLVQLCDLLREMAITGDTLARNKLKEVVFKIARTESDDEHAVAETFIDIQNEDEFVELAKIYGNRLLKNKDAFPFDGLIPEAKTQEFRELLFQNAQKDRAIRKYWEYLTDRDCLYNTQKVIDKVAAKRDWHNKARQLFVLDQILDDARNKKGIFPGHYATFGKHATKEELVAVYDSLVCEEDPLVKMRLLWVFRGAKLQEVTDSLLDLANSTDEGLRKATISSLSQMDNEKVHKLAKEKVIKAELLGPDNGTISLFQNNYEKSDAQLITSALYAIEAKDEDIHALGYDLIELSKIQADHNLSKALKWVYEYTPCMHCRYQALLQLKGFNEIDEEIKQELPFDAEEDIRALAGN